MDTQAEEASWDCTMEELRMSYCSGSGLCIERAPHNKDGVFWFLCNDPFAPATLIKTAKNKALLNGYGMIAGDVSPPPPSLFL